MTVPIEQPVNRLAEIAKPSLTELSYDFFKECLKNEVIKYNPESGTRPIDQEKLAVIYRPFEPAFKQTDEKVETLEVDLMVPRDFDWTKSSKNALRAAIGILSQSKLIDQETTVNASKFLGPGNINIIPGSNEGLFNNWQYVLHQMDKNRFQVGMPIPIPANKEERNQYITLDIGTQVTLSLAKDKLIHAKAAGIEMTSQQAIEIALLEITAHEYGHAIDDAVKTKGIDTFARAEQLNPGVFALLPKAYRVSTHNEHFARGIQEIVLKQYLKKQGYSNEDTERFVTADQEERSKQAQIVKDFIYWMQQQGFDIKTIHHIEVDLRLAVMKLFGEETRGYLPDIQKALSYADLPYTEEGIKKLLAK